MYLTHLITSLSASAIAPITTLSPSPITVPTTHITHAKALIAANNSGCMRYFAFERYGRKMLNRLNGNIPWSRRMPIVGSIDWASTVRLRFILRENEYASEKIGTCATMRCNYYRIVPFQPE